MRHSVSTPVPYPFRDDPGQITAAISRMISATINRVYNPRATSIPVTLRPEQGSVGNTPKPTLGYPWSYDS